MGSFDLIQGLSTLESLRGFESSRILPSVLPVMPCRHRVGSTDLSRLMERCCHRPGQCYLPDKEFRSSIFFYVNQSHRKNNASSHCSCMSPCRWDYIFTDGEVGVWRVVSEDSDHLPISLSC